VEAEVGGVDAGGGGGDESVLDFGLEALEEPVPRPPRPPPVNLASFLMGLSMEKPFERWLAPCEDPRPVEWALARKELIDSQMEVGRILQRSGGGASDGIGKVQLE